MPETLANPRLVRVAYGNPSLRISLGLRKFVKSLFPPISPKAIEWICVVSMFKVCVLFRYVVLLACFQHVSGRLFFHVEKLPRMPALWQYYEPCKLLCSGSRRR